MGEEERPYLLELFIMVLLSVLFTAIISEFFQGVQKIMFLVIIIFAIMGLISILGSVRGWRLLSVYSFSIPCSKMLELDSQWDKIIRRMTHSIFSLPKETKFFPEVWLHKNVEHRNIQIFSRSIENLNFLKNKLGKIKHIKQGRESIFRHLSSEFRSGNTNMYGYRSYRRYLAKLDWGDLLKIVTPLKLELTEFYKNKEIKIKEKKLTKELSLELEIHLKHGYLMLEIYFDKSSNVHVLSQYFESPSRNVRECIETKDKNLGKIIDFLEKLLGDKYVIKERAGSEISDEMITGERYLSMNSWGSMPEFLVHA